MASWPWARDWTLHRAVCRGRPCGWLSQTQDTVCFVHVTVIPTLCPAKDAGRAQPPENTEKTKADPPGFSKYCLYQFPRTAVTNYHKLGGLRQHKVILMTSGQKSEIKVWAGLISFGGTGGKWVGGPHPCLCSSFFFSIFTFKFYLSIYLAALGLSCGRKLDLDR